MVYLFDENNVNKRRIDLYELNILHIIYKVLHSESVLLDDRNMDFVFAHRYEGGVVLYNENGITIRPRFSKHGLLIEWSNVSFISITPAVIRKGDQWKTYMGASLMADDALQELHFLHFAIVVHNRHALAMHGLSLFQRLVFHMGLPSINSTFDAYDKPMPDQGYISYALRKKTLNRPLRDLLSYLIAKTKFDLLCFDS